MPFTFASFLWCVEGRWESTATCTIITTKLNDVTLDVHDRMPVPKR
ncbi:MULTISPECIES: SOS response-associated peptidase family protein [unclassified Niallia]